MHCGNDEADNLLKSCVVSGDPSKVYILKLAAGSDCITTNENTCQTHLVCEPKAKAETSGTCKIPTGGDCSADTTHCQKGSECVSSDLN